MRLDRRFAAATAPAAEPRPRALLSWAFYLFVATLPFEIPNRTIPVETTTLSAALLLGVAVLQPRVAFRRPPLVFWLFAAYLYAVLMAFVLNGAEHGGETMAGMIRRIQLILVFLVGYNVMRDPMVARRALIALGLACAALAALTITGVVAAPAFVDGARRITAFGQNPNRAAVIMGGGLLAVVGLAYGGARPTLRPRFLAWGAAALIGAAILDTGSRGGLLSLSAGLLALTLGGRGIGIRLRNAFMALVGIVALTWAALQSPLMQRRLQLAQGGNLAGREEIFPLAWKMFMEKPIVGWGAENNYELALRISDGVHSSRDTHNVVLELLTSTGVLGGIPFLAAMAICALAAWRARAGPLGITPFAILGLLFAASMSGNYIVLKLLWVGLALGLASRHMLPVAAPAGPPVPQPASWRPSVLRPAPRQ